MQCKALAEVKQETEVQHKATSAKSDHKTLGSCPTHHNMCDGEIKKIEKYAHNNPYTS